jgi:xylan 1,4-beta-xylosidase
MKVFIIIVWVTAIVSMGANGQSPSFKTYMNPVIPGDHPDCTFTKVGTHFYTTGSSFNPTPVIYHSTDMVHWEAIARPVSASWSNYGDTPGGGCWGGHIVYYNGKYWDFFGRGFVMYFVKADDPKGPWSEPVRVNNPSTLSYGLGADNSIFIDDNNKWYLVVKNGQPNNGIVELGSTGQPTGVVYDLKWLNPAPSYPYSWAEGPVMWKYKGYYYYSFARDVAGGQKVMRSKTLTADQSAWEILGDFFNENDPLKASSLFTGPNHASPSVMIDDSTSWVVHPVYAKGEWKGQGRQGLLNQVRYNSNSRPVADYPVNQPFTAPKLPGSGIPWMVPKSDFFASSVLHPEWSFSGYTPANKFSLSDRPGWLRLTPKSSIKANTVIKNDGEHNYALITRLDFSPKSANDEAGLWIMRGDETMFVKLSSSVNANGRKAVVFSFNTSRFESENRMGDTLWLKMVRVNHIISGYFSGNGNEWTQVGQTIDISAVDSYSDFTSWAGTRQGLYVQGARDAWFDLYIYRDAYTPILAECPANQDGTSKTSAGSGISVLDNIHHNDWALYAGVEFGTGDSNGVPDSVEFTASCASTGGTVEIWLDSIGSGTKIADCKIYNTGSWYEFKSFTSFVNPVTGNHDVYLRFSGSGTNKLFMLKWMKFIKKSDPINSASRIEKTGNLSIYPNPAKDRLSIVSGFQFDKVEIFSITGSLVYQYKTGATVKSVLNLNLDSGIYVLKVSSEKNAASLKLMIDSGL